MSTPAGPDAAAAVRSISRLTAAHPGFRFSSEDVGPRRGTRWVAVRRDQAASGLAVFITPALPDDNTVIPLTTRSRPPGQLTDCPQWTAGEDPAEWLSAIADGLDAAGFPARLDKQWAARAVTVTIRPPGHREAEIILDDDGYAELRWWPGPDATPVGVTSVLTRLLAVIAAPAGQAGST